MDSISVPLYNISTSRLKEVTTVGFEDIENIFSSNNVIPHALDPYYCPNIVPYSDPGGRLANLRTKPYDIYKFRNYKVYVANDNYWTDFQNLNVRHIHTSEYPDALYGNIPGSDHEFINLNRAYMPELYTSSAILHDGIFIDVPANRMLNVHFNFGKYLNINTQERILKIIDPISNSILFEKSSNSINGSDVKSYEYVIREFEAGGPEWNFYKTYVYTDSMYNADSEESDTYPFYYHNTSTSTKRLYLEIKGYGWRSNQLCNTHIYITTNKIWDGNNLVCTPNNNYSHYRGNAWVAQLTPNQSYTLQVSGGNGLYTGLGTSGLTFKMDYLKSNGTKGFIYLYYNGSPGIQWSHTSNITKNYLFTVPSDAVYVYPIFAANRKFTKYISAFEQNVYQGCQYTFKIY